MANAEIRVRVPAELAGALRALAAARGLAPEALATEWIAGAIASNVAPAPDEADLASRETQAGGGGRELAAAAWRVILVPAAAAELDALPAALRDEVRRQAQPLAAEPATSGRRTGDRWRCAFRYAGVDWRIVYTLDGASRTVRVLLVTTREKAVY